MLSNSEHLPLPLDDAASAKVPTYEQYFRVHVSLRMEMLVQERAERCTVAKGLCFLPRVLSLWEDDSRKEGARDMKRNME